MTRRGRLFLLVFVVLALVFCGSACGTRVALDHRAAEFESRCQAIEGATVADAMDRFESIPALHFGNELSFTYHYGFAGRTTCTFEIASGHVMRYRAERGNDFDHCTDPISYPRRHWVCSIARVVVP